MVTLMSLTYILFNVTVIFIWMNPLPKNSPFTLLSHSTMAICCQLPDINRVTDMVFSFSVYIYETVATILVDVRCQL